MMKAIKNFTNKPITWGDSFKWSGVVLGLYATALGLYWLSDKLTKLKEQKAMLNKMRESNLEEDEI